MENSLLPEMLQLLHRNETFALRKFLQSPYHNTRTDVVRLFEYILANNTLSLEITADREVLFKAVYAATPFDSKQLNYVVSYLIKLIEQFIAQEEYAQSAATQSLHIVRGFRRRHCLHLSERAARTAVKKLEKQARRNASYYWERFYLANETLRGQAQQGRSLEFDFDKLNEAHEKAFFIERLQLGCMVQSRQAVASKAYETGFLPVLLAFLKDHPWLQEPAMAAWYYAYCMQTDQNAPVHFERLKTVIFENSMLFNDLEQHDLFLLAVNFCIRRINSGDAAFSRELFDLYKEGLLQNVFLENGILSRWSYNNIVNAALKIGEITWAMQFLEQYRAKLEPAFRDTNYYFNLARCLYEKGDYDPALESLTHMEYDDMLQNLSARTLQIKIYHDTAAWQALDSLLDSVRIYIRRKKVLGYHKENYSNIVRFVQRIMALPPGDRAARAQLREEMMQCKVLSERAWLLARVGF